MIDPGVPRAQRGFTLIELLVVITIIAVMAGMVVLNINFRNPGKSVANLASRTGLLMQLASDQAVYSRQQFGIRFHPESYEFYMLASNDDGEASWQIIDDDRLRFAQPDYPVEFQVDISGLPIVLEPLVDELESVTDDEPLKPHVMFLSNGEIMPDFLIRIADAEDEFHHEIRVGELEPIVVEQVP